MKVINEKPGALVPGDKIVNCGDWFLVMGTKHRGIFVDVEVMRLGGELAGKAHRFSFPTNRNLTVHCKCIDEHDDAREFDG